MMGWICYLVLWAKTAWAKLQEAADRQRRYWEDEGCP